MQNATRLMIMFGQISSYCFFTFKVMAVRIIEGTVICVASAVLRSVFDDERTNENRLNYLVHLDI
jgi:hypothetical protein